jgi:predicted Zn-dependent protease with MMP-like domain
MKIPETVKVGPFTYKVSLVDIVNRDRPELIGEVAHCINKEIRLQKDLDQDKMESVFIHELLHCVDVFMHLGLSEEQVERLEGAVYMVLKQNDLLRE